MASVKIEHAGEEPAPAKGPVAQIIASANATVDMEDSTGRILTIKKPTFLQKNNILRLVGGEISQNPPALGFIMLAVWVVAIDGDPVKFPSTMLQVDALLSRLDDAGIEAALKGKLEIDPVSNESDGDAKNS